MKKSLFKALGVLAASCLMVLAGNSAIAADTGGTIKGRVTTESGDSVSGAAVTMRHNSKGVVRSAITDGNGDYFLRDLPVGDYTLTISKDGYNTSKQENVAVTVGTAQVFTNILQVGSSVEEVVVVGTPTTRLDMAETTSGMTFDDVLMDQMPIDNGFEEMVLMTPGTAATAAGSTFRGASSIGGASSAENAYYLNGINVTQIQSGLGAFALPWEAIAQTNVQTGGITAEFGGALGGIVNAVSKTGSNEFEFGVSHRIDPDSGFTAHDSIRAVSDPTSYWMNNEQDISEFNETNIWASGPIVQDKAFFYVLLNPRKSDFGGAGNTTYSETEETSDRWFVNTEYFLSDRHSIGVTGFSNKTESEINNFVYDNTTDAIGTFNGLTTSEFGGTFWGTNYRGELTDNLTLNIIYGSTKEEEIPRPQNLRPLMQDCRTGSCFTYSTNSDSSVNPQEFVRDQYRADFTWELEDHSVQFGIDSYSVGVLVDTRQNGVVIGDPANVDTAAAFGWWLTDIADATDAAALNAGVPLNTQYVRRRVRLRFSDSEVNSQAFYVQDSWRATDTVTLNYGVRFTDFENTVSSGEAYADLDGNVAPRLAAVWDINGDGSSKAYASWGRYFQPVAARMNITQGSSSIEYFDYYATDQVDGTGRPVLLSDGSPSRGNQFGSRVYRQTGITDPNLIASSNLEAMYSDQISIGYQTEVFDSLTAGIRATYSELKRSVEDTDYGPILQNKLTALGFLDPNDPNMDDLDEIPPFQGSFYVLANPGDDVQVSYDFNGDGTVDTVTLTAADHQLPKAQRKYGAIELTLGGQLNSRFAFDASYTWSHSYGNTEGLVKSDNEQADPGWTTAYDYGDLMDGAYGNLPNDHRHALKFAGLYDLTDNLSWGIVFRATSGRPQSIFGVHPAGVGSCATGNPWNACISQFYDEATHYDENGTFIPRGSIGTLPMVKELDMSLTYKKEDVLGGALTLKATVFNLLGFDDPVQINEITGQDYGLTDRYQDARYLSLIGRLEF